MAYDAGRIKGNHVQFLRVLWIWYCLGKHAVEEGAKSSTFRYAGRSNRLYATLGVAWAYITSKSTFTVIHFLQQGHTYSIMTTPPNSVIPYEPSLQTHESTGTIYIQTTTGGL